MIQLLGPPFWSTVVGVTGGVGDTFDRADNASSLGTASDGATWTAVSTWGITGNKAYSPNASGAGPGGITLAYRSGIGSGTNYTVSMSIHTTDQPAVLFRVQDGTNFWAFMLDSGGIVRLYKCVAGSLTLMDSAAGTYFTGQTVTAAVTSNGTSGDMTCKIDGVNQILLTDATFKTQVIVGMATFAPNATPVSTFDTLTVV